MYHQFGWCVVLNRHFSLVHSHSVAFGSYQFNHLGVIGAVWPPTSGCELEDRGFIQEVTGNASQLLLLRMARKLDR